MIEALIRNDTEIGRDSVTVYVFEREGDSRREFSVQSEDAGSGLDTWVIEQHAPTSAAMLMKPFVVIPRSMSGGLLRALRDAIDRHLGAPDRGYADGKLEAREDEIDWLRSIVFTVVRK